MVGVLCIAIQASLGMGGAKNIFLKLTRAVQSFVALTNWKEI